MLRQRCSVLFLVFRNLRFDLVDGVVARHFGRVTRFGAFLDSSMDRVVDILVTNFHLPRSSLLMLVCSLGGRERVLDAYRLAVAAGYRFYSYGDCMVVDRASGR